ncbi:hypothetical protein [Streptomyces sp. LaPpAH-108]|uniref:hypothetical protein n=1 Tax=Streptomyces sp. LaPpAH-108 TaxID=1155714 RepID=UPI0004775F6B|nr:hypothetical protein [Streptomyces sp. LaPpAH-108]
MSTAPPPERPDDSGESAAISDEQWDTFLRETVEGGGPPAPKEPSARARVVARRLREEGEREAAAGGRFGRRRKAAQAPGWRTGTAVREKRRGPLWAVLGVLLAVAVCLVAVRPSLLLDRIPGGGPVSGASPLPAETALPSGAPGAASGTATLDHPFRGSPALIWDEGADAIELPPVKAVGGFSEAEVALALRLTKDYLVDTNLDPKVLRGGRPDKALALLDPKQPKTLSELKRALRDPDAEHDPLPYVSRFDPARVRPAGDVVKVRGHLSFAAGRPGEMKVHADYTFVYPLVRRGSGDDRPADDRVARSIVRRDVTMELHDPATWDTVKGKLAVDSVSVSTYNNECGVSDGYLHPLFPGAAPTGAPAHGDAKDPYDRREPLDIRRDGDCGRITRS